MAYELSTHEHTHLLDALMLSIASVKRAINTERSQTIRDIRRQNYDELMQLSTILSRGDYTGPNYRPVLIPKEEIETPKRR